MAENIEFTQQIPLRYTPDIAVVGGGMAGVGAACVAAMQGCSVLLIEEFATLGGAATVGGVWGFCGETIGMGAIFEEILHDLARFHGVDGYSNKKDPAFRNRKYDPEILAFVLQEIVLRHHVQVLLHTRLAAVVQDAQKIISRLIVAGPSGLEAVSAKWVIDCTGDARVATFARCEVMKGSSQSPLYLPMAYVGFVRNRRWFSKSLVIPSDCVPGTHYSRFSELPMISLKSTPSGNSGLKIKVPMFNPTNTLSLTAAEIEGRRKFMRVVRFYQNHGKFRWTVSHASPIIGIRDGGQIRGLHVLTVDDVRAGKAFFDAVAVGT
nr:FAD-dependent oxidoreductase [Candidatus Sigynarchaeota archaeon]